ncbi:SusE domain-containing protein [Polaribacter litorisediminis]|uniref:SusE domain-containing protein n=1 Tax=Polaribacter litorisediminis TaxID=1908341 RepID=UPI001CBD6678|nr:SusE domain-containing protein [Polaribacter litorisediminis]
MMKNIKRFSAITIIGVFMVLFHACDDSSDLFTVVQPDAPVLAALDFTDLELDPINTSNPAITLNWDDADYGQQTSINYAIEFSKDAEFTDPVIAATTTGRTTITLSINEVNASAGNAGLNPFEWKPLYVRIVSSLGTQNQIESASNTLTFNVYPYFNYVFNDYYLVGNATAPDWNNNNNNPALFRDANDSNRFYYTGYFGEGEFKILETKGLWQPQWGTNDASSIDVNPGDGSDPGTFPNNNTAISTPGYYQFSIDFATNTFDFQPFDATGITSPASLTIQGSSAANITMNALGFDGHIWYANNVRLIPGNFEFVTGAGANWGSSTSFSGVATDGGGAIPVIVEDDYDVWFNDLTGRYVLIPLNL